MKNGLEDYYVIRGNKKMRFGYTTGSCAAAACKGATEILLGGKLQETVTLMTPKGILLTLELKDIQIETDKVTCAIRKDAGDDPDTTNGILVYATVEKTKEQGITLDGGIGVGRVTKAGLSQKIGEAAINPVPKSMIIRADTEIAEKYDYEGGLKIIIAVPEGVEENVQSQTGNRRRNLNSWNIRYRRAYERGSPCPEHPGGNETALFPGRRISSGNTGKLRCRLSERTHESPI